MAGLLPTASQVALGALFQMPPAVPGLGPHGRKFFVGNSSTVLQYKQSAASDNLGKNNGIELERPFSTTAVATGQCVAGRGDAVFFLPGHAESLASAAAIASSKNGVFYKGLGTGAERATFTFATLTSATWTVAGSGVTFEDLDFIASIDELVTMFSVTGSDCTFRRCRFWLTDVTDALSVQILAAITGSAAATNLTVESCVFRGLGVAAATGGTVAISIGAAYGASILGNFMQGAFTQTTGAIANAAAGVRWRILGNEIINLTTGSTKVFVLHAGTSGLYDDNRMGILSGTSPVTAAGMYRGDRNRYAAAVNSTMLVLP